MVHKAKLIMDSVGKEALIKELAPLMRLMHLAEIPMIVVRRDALHTGTYHVDIDDGSCDDEVSLLD